MPSSVRLTTSCIYMLYLKEGATILHVPSIMPHFFKFMTPTALNVAFWGFITGLVEETGHMCFINTVWYYSIPHKHHCYVDLLSMLLWHVDNGQDRLCVHVLPLVTSGLLTLDWLWLKSHANKGQGHNAHTTVITRQGSTLTSETGGPPGPPEANSTCPNSNLGGPVYNFIKSCINSYILL